MGLHRRPRDRGLPRRRRDRGRGGGPAAHGAVRAPGPAPVAAGRPRTQGARADRGVAAACCRHRCGRGGGGRGSPDPDRLCPCGAVDHRRDPLSPGPLGVAPVVVPQRVRARERQRRAGAARLRRHAGRTAAGRPAAAGQWHTRALRRGGGRFAVGRRAAPTAPVRRAPAPLCAAGHPPGRLGGGGHPGGQSQPRPLPDHESRRGTVVHPWRAHGADRGGRDRPARHR